MIAVVTAIESRPSDRRKSRQLYDYDRQLGPTNLQASALPRPYCITINMTHLNQFLMFKLLCVTVPVFKFTICKKLSSPYNGLCVFEALCPWRALDSRDDLPPWWLASDGL